MVLAILLILYVGFAYGRPPRLIKHFLHSHIGKVIGLAGLFLLSMHVQAGVTMLAAIALLISMPAFEFFTNNQPGATSEFAKAPGKNIQERKAPHIDVESQLRKPTVAALVPAHPTPNKKKKPLKPHEAEVPHAARSIH
jgi:hypothetical protein